MLGSSSLVPADAKGDQKAANDARRRTGFAVVVVMVNCKRYSALEEYVR